MDQDPRGPKSAGGRCPICGRPTDPGYRPFCSRRCADVDLSRWLKGTYAIPGGTSDADEDGDEAHAARAPRTNKHEAPHEDE